MYFYRNHQEEDVKSWRFALNVYLRSKSSTTPSDNISLIAFSFEVLMHRIDRVHSSSDIISDACVAVKCVPISTTFTFPTADPFSQMICGTISFNGLLSTLVAICE